MKRIGEIEIGDDEVNKQFLTNRDRLLVYIAAERVIREVGTKTFRLPLLVGAKTIDVGMPNFDYPKIALEAYRELLKRRYNILSFSLERQITFLTEYIRKKRLDCR